MKKINDKKISVMQMGLTFVLTICLILANILAVKPIFIFGIPQLVNTCGILTFPITYVLSDVFSECYGYKWSRISALFAFFGTIFCSLMFSLMINMQGTPSWSNQEALINILGSTPRIAVCSVIAFYIGDLANDFAFARLKLLHGTKWFGLRAIVSSLIGKYADEVIMDFFGLPFLTSQEKAYKLISSPLTQICIEVLLLPLTYFVVKKVKAIERVQDVF